MKGLVLSTVAGAALSIMSVGSAFSASCSGTLTNNCIVIDEDGDFATEAVPNPLVDLRVGNDLGINEAFLFFANQIGAFSTTGDFDVAGGIQSPVTTLVTISTGGAGNFSALNLAFNGGVAQSILAGGTFFFNLLAGANNTFAVTGTANPVFAGPVSYNIALSAVNAIPLPPAALLFGTALAGMGLLARRRRRV
jgi:hypothetical protein